MEGHSKIITITDGKGNHLNTFKIAKARDYSDEYMFDVALKYMHHQHGRSERKLKFAKE